MHNSKPNPTTDHAHRRVVIQHGNETSVGTAVPRDRKDVLDRENGGVNDIGIGPGNGSAPGSTGPGEPHDGDDRGIPYGVS